MNVLYLFYSIFQIWAFKKEQYENQDQSGPAKPRRMTIVTAQVGDVHPYKGGAKEARRRAGTLREERGRGRGVGMQPLGTREISP